MQLKFKLIMNKNVLKNIDMAYSKLYCEIKIFQR